jgi:hypothetical protein
MGDADLRKKMGLAAIETSKKYHPDIIHSKWESLLLRAAASKSFRFKLRRKAKMLLNPLKSYFAKRDAAIICGLINLRTNFRATCMSENRFRLWVIIVFKCFHVYVFLWGKKLFDPRFYLQEYFEVKKLGIDPLFHYVTKGWIEGKNPSAFFDNNAYIKNVMGNNVGICPLYHYYTVGLYNNAEYMIPKTRYANLSINKHDYTYVKKRIQQEAKKFNA